MLSPDDPKYGEGNKLPVHFLDRKENILTGEINGAEE